MGQINTMKLKIFAMLLLAVSVLAQQPVTITLGWSYPTNSSNPYNGNSDLFFLIRSNNTLTTNASAWPVFTNASASNTMTTNLDAGGSNFLCSLPVTLPPATYFFVVQSSNLWGFSSTSNITNTSPAPGQVISNNIHR